MTSDMIRELVARFENGERLTRDEKNLIYRHLDDEPEFLSDLVERLAVAELLSFRESSKDSASFIAEVTEKFSVELTERNFPDLTHTESVSDNSRPLLLLPQVASFTLLALVAGFLLGAWAWSTWDRDLSQPNEPVVSTLENENGRFEKSVEEDSVESPAPVLVADNALANGQKEDNLAVEPTPSSEIQVAAPEASVNMVQVEPAENPKSEVGDPFMPDEKTSPQERVVVPVVLATILNDKDAKWATANEYESQLTAKPYELLAGKTNFELDNGVRIGLLGPSEFELVSGNQIKVFSGVYFVEMPRKQVDLEIEMPHATLSGGNYARIQMIVGDQKSETFLTRGSINLLPRSDQPDDELRLQKSSFVQALVQESKGLPRMLAATGPKRFEARLGEGNRQARFSSPLVFGNVLQNIESSQKQNPGLVREPQSWQALIERIRGMPANPSKEHIEEQFKQLLGFAEKNAGKKRDVTPNRSSSFQGSFSINGVTREFNSIEDFERFRQEWRKPRVDQPGSVGQMSFPEVPFRFSSPDTFRQLRKQMR